MRDGYRFPLIRNSVEHGLGQAQPNGPIHVLEAHEDAESPSLSLL